MKNFRGLKKGDRLLRNSYSCYHFTTGHNYEVLTISNGYPRVLGDNGVLVTIKPPYSAKYFDQVEELNIYDLKAGDLIQFTKNLVNIQVGKTYIVNKFPDGTKPYVYNEKGKVIYLSNGFGMKLVGKLSDLKGEDNMKNRLADQVKVGDVIKRIKPGGRYHAMGFTYKVTGIDNDGTVFVNTDQGFNRSIKPDSEKNWEVVEPKAVRNTFAFSEEIEELKTLIDRTTQIRSAIKNHFKDMGMDEATAKAATEQVILKGLNQR